MPAERRLAPRSRFELVVVLASLGGLPVISALVAGLPAVFPVPLLVMQHRQGSGKPDMLAWILQQRTVLPVHAAPPGMSACTAGVTVIPGGFTAAVYPEGRLALGETGVMGGNALLTTAAAATDGAVIGVVLSGMLHDGAAGVRAVKRHGGRVLAQDPATARASGMPSSAIATGCVDFVLAPERMASALVALTMAPGGADLLEVPPPHWATMGA